MLIPCRKKKEPSDEGRTEIYDRYGKGLILRKDPLLLEYLEDQKRIMEDILTRLRAQDASEGRVRRLREVENEWGLLCKAMELMK